MKNLNNIIISYLSPELVFEIIKNVKRQNIILSYYRSLPNITFCINNNYTKLALYLIQSKHKYRTKILYLASYVGHIEIIKLLLSKGLKMHHGYIETICIQGYLNILKYLISKKIELPIDLIKISATSGHLNIVKYLFQLDPKIYKFQIYSKITYYVCEQPQLDYTKAVEMVKYLHSKNVEFYKDCIRISCIRGNLQMIQFLVENGVKPTFADMTPALISGNLDIVTYLFNNGVKPTSLQLEYFPSGHTGINQFWKNHGLL